MITVEHLTKRYGDFLAVEDLSFEIREGHVYGFLGPNGAGKSTTMNIVTGCLSATEGSIRIDGYDIFEQPDRAKRLIGYLPEQPPLYLGESPAEYLRFVGEAKGLRGEELKLQIAAVMEQTGIQAVAHRRIADLSKGYRQRVGIAQALLGDPKVIILDEPTVGLDPLQIIEIRDLIKKLGETHTVIFSSHILSEVQAICDEILIINKGRLVALGTPADLEKQLLSSNAIDLTAEAAVDEAAALVAGVEHITDISVEEKAPGWAEIHLATDSQDIYAVSRALFLTFAQAGRPLLEMTLKKASLEDIFLELTEDAAQPEDREPPQRDPERPDETDGNAQESEVDDQ